VNNVLDDFKVYCTCALQMVGSGSGSGKITLILRRIVQKSTRFGSFLVRECATNKVLEGLSACRNVTMKNSPLCSSTYIVLQAIKCFHSLMTRHKEKCLFFFFLCTLALLHLAPSDSTVFAATLALKARRSNPTRLDLIHDSAS
jgi:hypothetical protein